MILMLLKPAIIIANELIATKIRVIIILIIAIAFISLITFLMP